MFSLMTNLNFWSIVHINTAGQFGLCVTNRAVTFLEWTVTLAEAHTLEDNRQQL